MTHTSNQGMGGGRVQDEGFSWVVLFACVVLNYFLAGGASLLGVLQVDLIKLYPEDKVILTWAAGLYMSLGFLLSVPFSWLLAKCGRRKVGITAALVISSSYMVAAFSNNPVLFLIFGGAITGASTGVYFNVAMMSSNKYFTKRRTLAQGTAMSALSLSFLTHPLICRGLIDLYSWRGAIMLHAALNLHAVPACLLLKEPRKGKNLFGCSKSRTPEKTTKDCEEKIPMKTAQLDPIPNGKPKQEELTTKVDIEHLPNCNGDIVYSTKELESRKESGNVKSLKDKCGPLAPLLHHPWLIVGVLGVFLVQCGNILPFVITPLMADHLGATRIKGALLLSIAAAVGIFFRGFCGYVADQGWIDKRVLCGSASVIGGSLTTGIAFVNNYAALAGIIACISIPSATFMGTWASVLADLVEKKFATLAVSYGSMGLGTAQMLAVGTTGLMLQLTGSPRMTFLIAGCIEMIGGLLFLSIHFFTRISCSQMKLKITGGK